MKKELSDLLYSKYPKVLSKKIPLYVGDGWFNLIDGVCDILENHIKYLPIEVQDQIYATTIKEKYGGLRFYLSHENDYIDGVITLAEYQSDLICEKCGLPGTHRDFDGWIKTLCEKDYKRELKSREDEKKTPKKC